jgi:hypothetical protein
MKVKSHLFSLSNNLDSILAALIGFFLIQIFSKHSGIGISPDSVTYLSAARHFVQGKGFVSFDNLPVVDFPFAYPFFLTVISFFTRQDPLQFGPLLNGFLFGILLYLSGCIMNGFNRSSRWYKRILLICILLSPALQEVYSYLWSETIFLILVLFFIICISNYLRHLTTGWLLISILICSLTCLTRYAGVFMILTGLFLIFFNRAFPWRKRILHCFLFGSLSFSLLFINIIRNLATTGLAMGPRPRSDTGILKIMEYFGGVLCDWLLLDRKPLLAITLTAVLLILFAITIIFTNNRKRSRYGFEYAMAVTGLIYCIFMIVTSSLTRYEQFTNRLLSPIFIPLLWSLSWWIPGFMYKKSYSLKWISGLLFLLVTIWFLNVQVRTDYEYYDGVKDAGIPGYREDPFVQSEIVQFLEKNKNIFDPRFSIYSNAGEAVYFVTGFPALQLPFIDFPAKVEGYYNGNYSNRPEYLVWFRDLDNPAMPDLKSILQHKNMVPVKELTDGAVYVTK